MLINVGDVYRDSPVVFHNVEEYGNGPYVITKITSEYGPRTVYVKSLEDGRCFGPWSHPRNWGVLDVFLTAVHRANHGKET